MSSEELGQLPASAPVEADKKVAVLKLRRKAAAPVVEAAAVVEPPAPVPSAAPEASVAPATDEPAPKRKRAPRRKPAAKRTSEAESAAPAGSETLPLFVARAEPEAAAPVEVLMPAAEPVAPVTAESVAPVAAAPLVEALAAAPEAAAAELPPLLPVIHRVHPVALGRKREVLQHLLGLEPERQTLVYTRTKHGADKITRSLERAGFKAAAVHGDKSQGARNRALSGFKSGDIKVLVITDIAARLVDLTELPIVLSYDLPHVAEDYVARISRLRAEGSALTLITQEESPQFRAVRARVGDALMLETVPGFEPPEAFDPERDPPAKPVPEAADAAVATPESGVAASAEGAATAAAPEPARGGRREREAERGPRAGRGRRERGPKPRGERPPRPVDAQAPVVEAADVDDDDQPGYGNSLHAPPPAQLGPGGKRRRRGRPDPFAPVVVDEERANIYDERQPDDYRDQWSVLGPDVGRPHWTYADNFSQPGQDIARHPAAPTQPRRGPGGGRGAAPRGPQAGPRGQQPGAPQRGPKPQRSGRPRRAEGR